MIRQNNSSLYINGEIDAQAAEEFAVAMAILDENAEQAEIWINSPGGDVFSAKEMANLIKKRKGKTKCIANGLVASSATYLLFASDSPVIFDDSVLMIHKPSCGSYGTSDDHKKTIEALDTIQKSMESEYLRFWKGTPEQLKRAIDRETWYTGSEAKELFSIPSEASEEVSVISLDTEEDKLIWSNGQRQCTEFHDRLKTDKVIEPEPVELPWTFTNQTVLL